MGAVPVMLRVEGRRCVVVGGGPVALRRARMLADAGAAVTVIAPHVLPDFDAIAAAIVRRPYQPGDLDGALLAVAATNDTAVNDAVAQHATQAGVLINRADDPEAGDFTVPARARRGPITLAVDTGGISPAAAAAIRGELSEALDPDWPHLLTLAAPYRVRIQQRFADLELRHDRLRRLTDAAAMAMLKSQGEEALRRHFDALSSTPA